MEQLLLKFFPGFRFLLAKASWLFRMNSMTIVKPRCPLNALHQTITGLGEFNTFAFHARQLVPEVTMNVSIRQSFGFRKWSLSSLQFCWD